MLVGLSVRVSNLFLIPLDGSRRGLVKDIVYPYNIYNGIVGSPLKSFFARVFLCPLVLVFMNHRYHNMPYVMIKISIESFVIRPYM